MKDGWHGGKYAFCESIYAGSSSRWHLRLLRSTGLHLGGGIDSESLCGHVKVNKGWDINVAITERHLDHACVRCAILYRERKASGGTGP